MQRLISKYGLAAHLAILAVAPLFLFPFYGDAVVAKVLFWLSIPVSVWILMEPSRREGERMYDARRRVLRDILHDPLFWFSVALTVIAFVRWFNNGVMMAYDAEISSWNLKAPLMIFFPGVVEDCGRLPLAVVVAFTVVTQGVRHALGASARMAFLFTLSTLAGIAAVVAVLDIAVGGSGAMRFMKCSTEFPSYVGVSFGMAMLAGTTSLVAAFEYRWHRIMILFIFSIGGTFAGLICFSPVYMALVLTGALLIMLAYSVCYSAKILSGAGEFKLLVLFSVSICTGLVFVHLLVDPAFVSSNLEQIFEWKLFKDEFWDVRDVLSRISADMWLSSPWIGTGIGSYQMALGFHAADADWGLVSASQAMPYSGWWHLIAERGIAGALMIAVPFLFLLWTYFYRLAFGILRRFPHPGCWLAPLAALSAAAMMFVDSSMLRPEALLVFSSLMAVSAGSFPPGKKKVKTEKENG